MRLHLVRGTDGMPAADFGAGHTGPNAIPRSTIRELARGDEPRGHRQLLPQWHRMDTTVHFRIARVR